MTSEKETLLLTTLLACCLHLDNFIVDVSTIAQDLSLGTPRYVRNMRSGDAIHTTPSQSS